MKSLSYNRIRSSWAKTIAAIALTVCLISSTAQAAAAKTGDVQQPQTLNADSAAAFLDQFFSSDKVKPHYIGAAVSVVKDGQIIAQKGYGRANEAQQTAVDPGRTVFRIASVSKTFTAVAIMQLVEQGKLDLKEDIRTYLTDLNFKNPFGTPVTVEHLLTHTSGFEVRDPEPGDIHRDFDKVVGIEEYVHSHMPPVIRKPGTAYMYDNFAYLLLGLIAQKVSGQPYETYMENHIFTPLDMKNSSFVLDGALKDNLAAGYDPAGKQLDSYALTPTIMPHGGMVATAEDIGKFMSAFLSEGASGNGNGRILTESSVRAMEQYRSSIHPLLPDTTYGFEAPFQLPGAGSSSQIISKLGDLNGYSSYLFLIPEQNTGVFLTYNKPGALRNLFYAQFISTFFPQYAAPAQLEAFKAETSRSLDKLKGLYADLRLSSFVSSVDTDAAGALRISDAFLGPRALQQVDDNLFVDDLTKQFTAFKFDDNGQVAYIKEPYINPLGYGRKGEQPVGFKDVSQEHSYAEYILALQSLGYYPSNANESFDPEKNVTRGAFVQRMLQASNIKGSKRTQPAFADIAGHPAAAYIQMAYELGMVTGTGGGRFEPERDVTRQESAVMLWQLLKAKYPPELFADVKLAGETSDWAVPAVQLMVALGLHGPEVQTLPDGTADFRSMKHMNRQEEAALLFKLLTQPTDQIVANKQAAQQQQR
ncbi:serine hydrolase [Paenibacillus xerothermodurans]|uniref:serine hydrolase n=1 Tax=Paenibacillus xerothermodurans TaxID=1977292 RepID=UPI001FB1B7CF|nr:serine hydrolase [Paenibacillus xerothermodurans]